MAARRSILTAMELSSKKLPIWPVRIKSRSYQERLPPSARFRRAGFACVVVTNQSGIGRGLITRDDIEAVHEHVRTIFAEQGAPLDAIYYCSTTPTTTDRAIVEDVNRKPGPGMLMQAAEELNIDLSRSWMVGDTISDVLAGRHAGCRGSLLVKTGHRLRDDEIACAESFVNVNDILAAADWILRESELDPRGKSPGI